MIPEFGKCNEHQKREKRGRMDSQYVLNWTDTTGVLSIAIHSTPHNLLLTDLSAMGMWFEIPVGPLVHLSVWKRMLFESSSLWPHSFAPWILKPTSKWSTLSFLLLRQRYHSRAIAAGFKTCFPSRFAAGFRSLLWYPSVLVFELKLFVSLDFHKSGEFTTPVTSRDIFCSQRGVNSKCSNRFFYFHRRFSSSSFVKRSWKKGGLNKLWTADFSIEHSSLMETFRFIPSGLKIPNEESTKTKDT